MKLSVWNFLVTTLLFLGSFAMAYECENFNPAARYYTSLRYIYDSSPNFEIYQTRYVPLNGNVYHYIHSYNPDKTVIQKIDSNGIIQWAKLYSKEPSYHSFDVSPDDEVIYFIENNSGNLNIFKLNTTDGAALLRK